MVYACLLILPTLVSQSTRCIFRIGLMGVGMGLRMRTCGFGCCGGQYEGECGAGLVRIMVVGWIGSIFVVCFHCNRTSICTSSYAYH